MLKSLSRSPLEFLDWARTGQDSSAFILGLSDQDSTAKMLAVGCSSHSNSSGIASRCGRTAAIASAIATATTSIAIAIATSLQLQGDQHHVWDKYHRHEMQFEWNFTMFEWIWHHLGLNCLSPQFSSTGISALAVPSCENLPYSFHTVCTQVSIASSLLRRSVFWGGGSGKSPGVKSGLPAALAENSWLSSPRLP